MSIKDPNKGVPTDASKSDFDSRDSQLKEIQ
jgi:hypothetical protein